MSLAPAYPVAGGVSIPAIASSAPRRDLRLDLFRGFALICIFIDHIPGNLFSAYTFQNLGFSDASELFVFISAYTAGLVYMGAARREDIVFASLRIWRRARQIYIAHFFLLVVFCAGVAWASVKFGTLSYVQGMNIQSFLEEPHVAILEALKLTFQPIFMDILPLYIVLLAFFPLMLWLIKKDRWLAFTLSLGLYVLVREFDFSLPDYPRGEAWKFNPLAWQLLFVIGAILGSSPRGGAFAVPRRRWLVALAATYAVAVYVVATMDWQYNVTGSLLPLELRTLLFPIMDRTNLSLWRVTHLLALAYLAASFLRADSPWLRSRVVRPLVLCGQHSLVIFCLGVLLSFAGWVVMVEVGSSPPLQFLVNAGGVAVLAAVAYALSLAFPRRGPQIAAASGKTVSTVPGVLATLR